MTKKILTLLTLIIFSIGAQALTLDNDVVSDKYGNKIKIKEYNKIIILDPAVTETFYMIGAKNKICAIGITMRSKIYPIEETKNLPTVGNIINPSLEKILSFSPDLVVLGGMSTKMSGNLKELNIPFIVNEAGTIKDILNNITIYGHLTGREKEANKLYNECNDKINNIRLQTKNAPLNLKGAIIYSTNPMMAFNEKALPGQILKLLGVNNLTDNLVGSRPILSQEFLLKENPDFLAGAMSIKESKDILNANPVIKKIKAGKNKNIFIIDSNKILRGSPRIFMGIEDLYKELKKIK